ncbi:hypothetical protein GIB67_020659 [Kingdonia uniflora]|uniref:TF-B3 domain-containing protein n=1 Tax=Kingdonia uniflora TaxID=39325 RepID=A0A7J7M970_9MAGN|nr:hypothetical protein GIB67_020659 [Kingdonia uniflora]
MQAAGSDAHKELSVFCRKLLQSCTTSFYQALKWDSARKSFRTSPTEKVWTIMLKQVDNDVFFHTGWRAFISDHSLEVRKFFVFRYGGNSKFNVKIYGRSCCEKKVITAKKKITGTSSCNEDSIQGETTKPKLMDNCHENMKNEATVINKTNCRLVKPMRTPIIKVEKKVATEAPSSGKSVQNNSMLTARVKKREAYIKTIPKELETKFDLKRKASVMLKDPQG